jgi:methyltransferase (TIGR00027 family)
VADASPVAHISDTAFLTALSRALEAERPDALIHDPLAWTLLGERAEAFLALRANPSAEFRSVALRSRLLDDLLLDTLEATGADVVLNLACGLDARPYRLPLPPALRWIEVDLPGVIAHKPRCSRTRRPAARSSGTPSTCRTFRPAGPCSPRSAPPRSAWWS